MAGKVKYNQLSEFEKKKYLGEFYSMVSLLKTREEVKNFFKDLLTLSEMVMISRRIQIAQMLLEGIGYEEIRKRLRVGFSTINHVERWLNNGFGGYRKTIMEYKRKGAKKKKRRLLAISALFQKMDSEKISSSFSYCKPTRKKGTRIKNPLRTCLQLSSIL